jgi:cell division protease FtsH
MSKEKTEYFEGLAGYDGVKYELGELLNWYKSDEVLGNKLLTLPKGILFYGPSGTGKSAFAKAMVKAFSWPCFIVDGEEEEACKELTNAIGKAKKNKRSVVFIDEIDLLLENDGKAVRLLRSAMDEENGIVYLATTNNLVCCDNALRREGRFERKVYVGYPDKEDVKQIYTFYLRRLGIEPKVLFDAVADNHPIFSCYVTGAGVRSIVNDAFLRKGKETKLADLQESYERIMNEEFSSVKPSKRSFEAAVHEAGHVVCIKANSFFFQFQRAVFKSDEAGGLTTFQECEDDCVKNRQEALFRNIVVALGGYYAEKVVLGRINGRDAALSEGVSDDLEKARAMAARLVNRLGFRGVDKTLPPVRDDSEREESPLLKFSNEREWRKILRKAGKIAEKTVKRYKKVILFLANHMVEKGEITQSDDVKIFALADEGRHQVPKIRKGSLLVKGKPVGEEWLAQQ